MEYQCDVCVCADCRKKERCEVCKTCDMNKYHSECPHGGFEEK